MDRAEQYATVAAQLESLATDSPGPTSLMASTAALLNDTFDHYFWVGFYLPDDDGSLIVGPYQGPLACERLAAGRGVCGACFTRRETILVPDVHAVEDHIACDARSQSEIVVPIVRDEHFLAVLDVDSATRNAFNDDDRAGLEQVARILAGYL